MLFQLCSATPRTSRVRMILASSVMLTGMCPPHTPNKEAYRLNRMRFIPVVLSMPHLYCDAPRNSVNSAPTLHSQAFMSFNNPTHFQHAIYTSPAINDHRSTPTARPPINLPLLSNIRQRRRPRNPFIHASSHPISRTS